MEQLFVELWSLVKQSGPLAGLLLFVLYAVNREREEYRKKNDQLNEEVRERAIKAINDVAGNLEDLRKMFEGRR